MKKFLCLVLALGIALSLAACSGGWKSTVTDYSGEVSSNGGFAVVKGDYVYFINGVESNTADNSFGTPVKGALVRVKLADLDKEEIPAGEVVIPQLVLTNAAEGSNGFYIYGDYVYYTTPSVDKDKTGAVQNTKLVYARTKLNGTDTTQITTVDNLTSSFRYVQSGDKVYLVLNTTNDDGQNVLISYDASKSNTVVARTDEVKDDERTVAVQNYVFSDDLSKNYCYYVETAYDKERGEDESYQNIVKFNFDGSDKTTVCEGSDGTQGATFTLIKDTGSEVYYSKTYVDTTVTTTVKYFVAKNGDFSASTLLSEATTNASTIFATTSYFKAPDAIVYFDSTKGFLKYDYTARNNVENYGVTYLVEDRQALSVISGLTVSSYQDGYVYMTDSSNYYYRISVETLLSGNLTEADVVRLTYVSLSTASTFYKPEIIGDYILAANDASPFGDYVYAVKMEKANLDDDAKEAKLAEYDFTVKENVEKFAKRRLGVITETDKETYDEYIKNTFEDEEE